jgi:hypothetical protein
MLINNTKTKLNFDLELERIVSLQRAAELQGLSVDTIKRRQADKIIRLSPRRCGMRLRDALLKQAV